MFKTIYDTFIKAIEEKDIETVLYILQNESVESVFKMLQDNDAAIFENTITKIVLKDKASIICIDHSSTLIAVDNCKVENLYIRVTIPNITQLECVDNLRKLLIDDYCIRLEVDDRGKLGTHLQIIATGSIRRSYKQ